MELTGTSRQRDRTLKVNAAIAPGVVFGSLHQMNDGRWMIANLYYNYVNSGAKYCAKEWWSGPTSSGPFNKFEGYGASVWANTGYLWCTQ